MHSPADHRNLPVINLPQAFELTGTLSRPTQAEPAEPYDSGALPRPPLGIITSPGPRPASNRDDWPRPAAASPAASPIMCLAITTAPQSVAGASGRPCASGDDTGRSAAALTLASPAHMSLLVGPREARMAGIGRNRSGNAANELIRQSSIKKRISESASIQRLSVYQRSFYFVSFGIV